MVRSTEARAELTLAIKACLAICMPAPCDSVLDAGVSEAAPGERVSASTRCLRA